MIIMREREKYIMTKFVIYLLILSSKRIEKEGFKVDKLVMYVTNYIFSLYKCIIS